MYSVVGCRECDALWIVDGRPETTGCPRCGRRHRFDRLRALAEVADEAAARRARSAILAERQGGDDVDATVDVTASAVSDEEYLGAAGLDADAVAAAAEPADRDRPTDARSAVEAAIRSLDEPTADGVLREAAADGIDPDRARDVLERLVRAGAVTERDGEYRLL